MSPLFKIVATALLAVTTLSATAQTTALNFNTTDCNGNAANLFADLDAGKAVILFYFMPNCGSCPPPAQKIQAMANRINATYPGKVKAYAFPFNNTTGCAYAKTWVTSNNLSLYAPVDSGASAVAHYGGFGMPTVVLVGGSNHRVMFSTLSFSTSDTTTMRDSILALIGAPTGLQEVAGNVSKIELYPNPSSEQTNINITLKAPGSLIIDVVDMVGRRVALISEDKTATGTLTKTFNTGGLATGSYTVRINADGKILNRKLHVVH